MGNGWRFPVMVVVSLAVLIGVLYATLYHRHERPSLRTILGVAALVSVGGMVFARVGAAMGLPVWVFYGIPAALTWLVPPMVFGMRAGELAAYIPMAVLSAPVIHVCFSFFLGWHEYMPFIRVPSLWNR